MNKLVKVIDQEESQYDSERSLDIKSMLTLCQQNMERVYGESNKTAEDLFLKTMHENKLRKNS